MAARSAFNFTGAVLAQAQGLWNVQKQNMGILEFDISNLVPGGREILTLALQEFTIPGRAVDTAELSYLNGQVKYATKPTALGDVSVTFRDFPEAGVRRILQQWFDLVYNETTGLMLPSSVLKTTGHMILFDSSGAKERSAKLFGVFPKKSPNDVSINYTSGEMLTMSIDFSVDRILWDSSLLSPAG